MWVARGVKSLVGGRVHLAAAVATQQAPSCVWRFLHGSGGSLLKPAEKPAEKSLLNPFISQHEQVGMNIHNINRLPQSLRTETYGHFLQSYVRGAEESGCALDSICMCQPDWEIHENREWLMSWGDPQQLFELTGYRACPDTEAHFDCV